MKLQFNKAELLSSCWDQDQFTKKGFNVDTGVSLVEILDSDISIKDKCYAIFILAGLSINEKKVLITTLNIGKAPKRSWTYIFMSDPDTFVTKVKNTLVI